MARIYKYECDFCAFQMEIKSNSTKPVGWTNLEMKTRPVEVNEISGDIKRDFLICTKCTQKLINVIANWKPDAQH